jgi:hypothetical protein
MLTLKLFFSNGHLDTDNQCGSQKKFKFHVKTHFIVFPMKYQHNTLILSSNFSGINMKASMAYMRWTC